MSVAIVTAAALVLFAIVVLRKHRQTWSEIFRLRAAIDDLHAQLVAARKESALLSAGTTRLPPLMPSQNGEDLWLWDFFGRKRDGFFVDAGAYDGVGFSNSYFFEAIGWSGVLVEAAPELHAECVAARPHSTVVHAAVGAANGSIAFTVVDGAQGVATLSSATPDTERIAREGGSTRVVDVPMRTLDDILRGVDRPIDFVSIDVEGAELDALRGFDLERFHPRILVIEENTHEAGARVREYLAARGYAPVHQIEQNVFYGGAR